MRLKRNLQKVAAFYTQLLRINDCVLYTTTAFYTQLLRIQRNLEYKCLSFVQQEPVHAAPLYRADIHNNDNDHSPLANSGDSDSADSEELEAQWSSLCDPLGDPRAAIRPPTANEEPPSLSEVMLTVLDWFSSHKQTYTATENPLEHTQRRELARAGAHEHALAY